MRQITQEQMKVFDAAKQKSLCDRITLHLYQHLPDTVTHLHRGDVKKAVEYNVSNAKEYGLTWESSITHYVSFVFLTGYKYEDIERIAVKYSNEQLEPDERIDYFASHVTEAEWDEIKSKLASL